MLTPPSHPQARGFTLIEIMVAMSIFAIVALVAVSALLTANRVNQRAQALKIATDNLHFALSSMVFQMRQGGYYYCVQNGDLLTTGSAAGFTGSADCSNGGTGIVFQTPKWGSSATVAYRLNSVAHRLEYWSGGLGSDFVPITSSNVTINDLHFYVVNNASQSAPRVLITLSGTARSSQDSVTFQLETLVSERI